MIIEFDNSAYVASHGRNPRGRGYWGFYIGADTLPWFCDDCKVRTLSGAKRAVAAHVRARFCGGYKPAKVWISVAP